MLLALMVLLMVGAFVGQLDVVARATGRIIPAKRLQIVQPLEGGSVAKILVNEGERVKAGQTLLIMDGRLSQADARKLESDLALAHLELRRVEAELSNSTFSRQSGDDPGWFDKVRAKYDANRSAHDSSVVELRAELDQARQDQAAARETRKKLSETLPLYREAERAYKKLATGGYSNRLALIDKQRERIEAEQDLRTQEHAISSLSARIEQTQSKLANLQAGYRKQLTDEQVELQSRITQITEELAKQRYRDAQLELKAPEAGFVKDVAVHTEGSVVQAGTVLMTVVPIDEPLQAEVLVDNRDIGVIATGQSAKVKLASYQFQRYGMVDAKVERISPDAMETDGSGRSAQVDLQGQQRYRTLLALDRQYLEAEGRRFDLKAGMQVMAEIKVGTRSVIEYLLSPIQRGLSEAGEER